MCVKSLAQIWLEQNRVNINLPGGIRVGSGSTHVESQLGYFFDFEISGWSSCFAYLSLLFPSEERIIIATWKSR